MTFLVLVIVCMRPRLDASSGHSSRMGQKKLSLGQALQDSTTIRCYKPTPRHVHSIPRSSVSVLMLRRVS